MSTEDPRCPECGEKIGQRATYCMHCSADLSDQRTGVDSDGDVDGSTTDGEGPGVSDSVSSVVDAAAEELGADSGASGTTTESATPSEPSESATAAEPSSQPTPDDAGGDELLDSDGVVDNTLTVIVGIVAGIVVGLVGTITVLVTVQSPWGFLLGVLAWIASTAHLIRRETVQGAISRGAYAVAAVLLLTTLIPLSPLVSVEGGIVGRIEGFAAALAVVSIPAGFAAVVGYVAGKFVPE